MGLGSTSGGAQGGLEAKDVGEALDEGADAAYGFRVPRRDRTPSRALR